MINYTIIAQEGDREARAYIEAKRPLSGYEPVVRERFQSMEILLEPDDEYMAKFKDVVFSEATRDHPDVTSKES